MLFFYGSVANALRQVGADAPAGKLVDAMPLAPAVADGDARICLCDRCGVVKGRNAMLRCGRCRTALYCSAECQKADWATHKRVCCSA